MRVGKLLKLIFSYFTNLSLTEPIIKYSAKNTRREKQKRIGRFRFIFCFYLWEGWWRNYFPDRPEILPILFRYLRDQRDFKAKREKWTGYWKSHSNVRTGCSASRDVWHLRPSCAEPRLRIRHNSRFNFQVTGIEKALWLHILQCDQPFPATWPVFGIWIVSSWVRKLSLIINTKTPTACFFYGLPEQSLGDFKLSNSSLLFQSLHCKFQPAASASSSIC